MDLRKRLKQLSAAGDAGSGTPTKKTRLNLNPIKYIKDSVTELRKVNWPTRQEVVRGTIGVIIVSALFVIVLGGSDILFQKGLSRILGEEINTQHAGGSGNGAAAPLDPKTGQPIDLEGLNIKTQPAANAPATQKEAPESQVPATKNQ